jgi:hypothetical protein
VLFAVDENLFYKGVNKKSVHGARLQKSTSISEPQLLAGMPLARPTANAEEHPLYPFESGHSLLMLTKKHNVRRSCLINKALR